MDRQKDVARLTELLASCGDVLTAMGDETRLHLILEMLKTGDCGGLRVGQITEKTNLSRPSVSHHLRILKDAGIVKVRKEGTKHYYYFDPRMESFEQLISALCLAMEITKALPDRMGEDETEDFI